MLRAALILLVLLLTGCPSGGRMDYQQGMMKLQAQDYQGASDSFDQALASEPDSSMAQLGKARALYGLGRFAEALPLFEAFLTATERDKTTYSGERSDAEFYRDKCKQQLGLEVPQNPENIPPPPMGE